MDDGLSGALIYSPLALHTQQMGTVGLASLVHAVGAVLCRCHDNYSYPLNSDEELAYDDR